MALPPRTFDLAEQLGYEAGLPLGKLLAAGAEIAVSAIRGAKSLNPYTAHEYRQAWDRGFDRGMSERNA